MYLHLWPLERGRSDLTRTYICNNWIGVVLVTPTWIGVVLVTPTYICDHWMGVVLVILTRTYICDKWIVVVLVILAITRYFWLWRNVVVDWFRWICVNHNIRSVSTAWIHCLTLDALVGSLWYSLTCSVLCALILIYFHVQHNTSLGGHRCICNHN